MRAQQEADGSLPGFNGDWAATSLAAAGVHPADVRRGGPSLQDWLFGVTATDDYRLATLPPSTVAGTIGKAALLAHAAGIRPTRVAPDVNLAAALATKWDAAEGTFTPHGSTATASRCSRATSWTSRAACARRSSR